MVWDWGRDYLFIQAMTALMSVSETFLQVFWYTSATDMMHNTLSLHFQH